MWRLRTFIKNIKRLIKWTPVIWNDREWDQDYLYAILEFKIKNMQEFYESGQSNTCQESVNETISEMKEIRRLIDRIRNDVYLDETSVEFNKKYPNYYKDAFNFEPVEGKSYSRLVSKAGKEAESEHRLCCEFAEKNKQEERKQLFGLLRDKIEGWWD
jgi:hypothetical protein